MPPPTNRGHPSTGSHGSFSWQAEGRPKGSRPPCPQALPEGPFWGELNRLFLTPSSPTPHSKSYTPCTNLSPFDVKSLWQHWKAEPHSAVFPNITSASFLPFLLATRTQRIPSVAHSIPVPQEGTSSPWMSLPEIATSRTELRG